MVERKIEQGIPECPAKLAPFVIEVVNNDERWSNIILRETDCPLKEGRKMLAVWTKISDVDWGNEWQSIHIYVNSLGLKKHCFPPRSPECKVLHEVIEARLCQEGESRNEAHMVAILFEFHKARDLGILGPYIKAELKSSLSGGLIRDTLQKVITYLKMRQE